jgi:hypothetical protein
VASEYSFRAERIPASAADIAFSFHSRNGDPHIWLRTKEQIREYAADGFLYGVRRTDSGALVGLCYVNQSADGLTRELGGLAVEDA